MFTVALKTAPVTPVQLQTVSTFDAKHLERPQLF